MAFEDVGFSKQDTEATFAHLKSGARGTFGSKDSLQPEDFRF